jgi:uncharacterized protein YqgC (DUF456 family)
MLILKISILIILFIGQVCTLAPALYGTLIILVAAGIYASIIGFSIFPLGGILSLFLLVIIAEVGGRWLRIYLTQDAKVSREYSVNTTVCNVAGIIVADAFLGALVGITIWELVVGKALLPRFENVGKVLVSLTLVAALRFLCGIIMIIIIYKYMIYAV